MPHAGSNRLDPRLGEEVVVFDEQEIDHQPDHLTGREVLSGRFVRKLREAADEFLVEVAHLQVRHRLGVQVDVAESRQDEEEEVRFVEPVDVDLEAELLDDVAGALRDPAM